MASRTLLACAVVAAACTAIPLHTSEDIVTLPFGRLRGNLNSLAREFLGIPFSPNPPRFAPSEPWTAPYTGGELEATHFSPACMQLVGPSVSALAVGNNTVSEDCLALNVFTPRQDRLTRDLLPVMIWIHGGALQTGSAMLPLYNGSRLAHTGNVVVVAINYRLGILGFPPVKTPDGTVWVNNGFKDQQQGMMWVQKHIAAFGGDASRVTIFGESAGGQSTAIHLVSPSSRGLFSRAIGESADEGFTYSLEQAQSNMDSISKAVGCADVSCLQKANVTDLLTLSSATNPDACDAVIDGVLLPGSPLEMVRQGKFNKEVDYVFGNNLHEGSLFIPGWGASSAMNGSWPASRAECVIAESFNATQAATVLELYPITQEQDNREMLVELMSDLFDHCANRELALSLDAAGASARLYSFRRQPYCTFADVPGASHTFEIQYVFQTTDSFNQTCVVPPGDAELAVEMSSLWGELAHNSPIASWPRFTAKNDAVVKFELGSKRDRLDIETGYRRAQCERLSRVGIVSEYFIRMMPAIYTC